MCLRLVIIMVSQSEAAYKSGPQFETKLKFYQDKYLSRLNEAKA